MVGVLLHAERGPLVWSQHEDILDAMVEGDAERSVELATDHVLGAKQALMDAMSSGKADYLFNLMPVKQQTSGGLERRRQGRR